MKKYEKTKWKNIKHEKKEKMKWKNEMKKRMHDNEKQWMNNSECKNMIQIW